MKHSGKLSAKLFPWCVIFLLLIHAGAIAQSVNPSVPVHQEVYLSSSPSVTKGLYGTRSGFKLKPEMTQEKFANGYNSVSCCNLSPVHYTNQLFPKKVAPATKLTRDEEFLLFGSLEVSKIHLSGPSFTDEEISSLLKFDFGFSMVFYLTHGGSRSSYVPVSEEIPQSAMVPENLSTGYITVRAGLKYIGRGVKESANNTTSKTIINYLVLPVYGVYNFASMSDGHIFAGLGPYVGYALNGKYKYEENGATTTTDISFGKDGGVKRADFGLSFIAGYEIKRFIVQIGFDLGLTNLGYDDVDKEYNRSFKIEFGYKLTNLFKK